MISLNIRDLLEAVADYVKADAAFKNQPSQHNAEQMLVATQRAQTFLDNYVDNRLEQALTRVAVVIKMNSSVLQGSGK